MDDHVISPGDRGVAARVFLSYAAEDRASARLLASSLTDRGWDVWWDRRLFAGSSFDEVIEDQLDAARAAIVLWSTTSVQSEWVRAEATAAIERDVLIPVLIEPCRVPLRFRNVHTLDLSGWDGDPANEHYDELERALRHLTRAHVAEERLGGPTDQGHTLPDDRPDESDDERVLDRSPAHERVDDAATVTHPTRSRRWIAVASGLVVVVALALVALVAIRAADDPSDIRSDGLDVGDWMYVGDRRTSTNGRYLLLLQEDGNLVVEDTDDPPAPPIWSSGTHGNPNAGALMQADGNFIIFGDRESENLQGTVVFTTKTEGNRGAALTIRNDGALVVESSSGTVLFDSRLSNGF